MAEPGTIVPPPAEVQKAAEKPPGGPIVEQPKPVGQAEQQLANRIQQDGNDPDQTLQNIASTPKFIREFSKEHSAEERQKTARDIWETRGEHFRQKREVAEQQTQIQEEVGKKESTLAEQRQRLEALRDEVARLSGPWFSRLLHYTRLRGLNADLQTAEEAYQTLQQEEATLRTQEQAVGTKADELKDAPKLEEGRQKIQDFYKREKEKWASADYTKEDIARYFTEEHLASLSTEDYALLLKRFPSNMVTHVTRQGIRDHVSGDFHTAGLGEYFDSFREILRDGRLRSNFGALFKNGLTKEAVAQALELGKSIRTRKDAKTMLAQFVSQGPGTGSYADRTALHVAAGEVVNAIYGGETGNEIFFAFPSAHIAAEHIIEGSLGGYRAEASIGDMHNDQWIWSKDHAGIAINAGVVFIPADARVDPKTGSKYELTSNKKPIERQDRSDGALYKEAEITIPSRDFWEEYFTRHPEQRPKRIVYYDGENPTEALRSWRESYDITKKTQSEDLGFPEKQVLTDEDPRQTVGMDRFKSIAEEVIDEYFTPKPRRKIAA